MPSARIVLPIEKQNNLYPNKSREVGSQARGFQARSSHKSACSSLKYWDGNIWTVCARRIEQEANRAVDGVKGLPA